VPSNDPPSAIWATRKGEPPHVREAFGRYLLERNMSKLAREVGSSRATLYVWASRWDWVDRAAAYDRATASETVMAAEVVAAKAAPGSGLPEVLETSRAIYRHLAYHVLSRLGDEDACTKVEASRSTLKLDDRDILRAAAEWGKILVTWEAAALAAARTAPEEAAPVDWDALSDDEVEQARQLQAKAGTRRVS
jgi:hypothetical protein